MSLRIDRSHMSQPMGGWGYAIPDGPVLSDAKLDRLIDKILAYRAANGLPPGDPEDDIARKYAPKFPWLIKHSDNEDDEVNDAEAWIHGTWKSYPLPMAEQRLRDERFAQCEKCIHFESLAFSELSPEAQRRVMLLNPSKHRVEHGWCLLRGWVPSIAVQINDPLKLADFTAQKQECWLKPVTKI